jgi:TonB family protein
MKRVLFLLWMVSFAPIIIGQGNSKIYENYEVDSRAVFGQGKLSFDEFLRYYQRYPEDALKNNITGTVILNVVVSEKGEVVSSQIVQSAGTVLDNEVERLAGLMPDFTPAQKNGVPVSSRVPLVFSFPNESKTTVTQTAATAPKSPLYVIDGKIVEKDIQLDAEKIESVRVMKGKKAIEKYGERARDGVLIFTTK